VKSLRGKLSLWEVGLGLLLAAGPIVFSDPFTLGIVTMTFLWAAASLAWNVSGGYAGQFSLGHAGFYGLGAYTSTILYLRTGLSPAFGMFAGAALCAAVAVILGWITIRLRGTFFVMATLAFGAVTHISAVNLKDLTRGTSGLSIPMKADVVNLVFASKFTYAYVALLLVILFYAISKAIEESRFGFSLVAFRENDDAARALGIRTLRARITAFALSAAMTSLCGSFHAQYYLYIDPDSVVSLNFSLQVALLAIVGGLGTAYGPVLGSLVITPISLLVQGSLGTQISGLNLFIYASIVIAVLLSVPEGLGPAALRLIRRRPA
jgi:branched-chain amino acid transport system permease protein